MPISVHFILIFCFHLVDLFINLSTSHRHTTSLIVASISMMWRCIFVWLVIYPHALIGHRRDQRHGPDGILTASRIVDGAEILGHEGMRGPTLIVPISRHREASRQDYHQNPQLPASNIAILILQTQLNVVIGLAPALSVSPVQPVPTPHHLTSSANFETTTDTLLLGRATPKLLFPLELLILSAEN